MIIGRDVSKEPYMQDFAPGAYKRSSSQRQKQVPSSWLKREIVFGLYKFFEIGQMKQELAQWKKGEIEHPAVFLFPLMLFAGITCVGLGVYMTVCNLLLEVPQDATSDVLEGFLAQSHKLRDTGDTSAYLGLALTLGSGVVKWLRKSL